MPGFPHAMPAEGVLGGLLIGIAAALMLLGNGRIAGVSGLAARAAGLAPAPRGERLPALAFVLGLPIGALAVALLSGGIAAHYPASPAIVLIGGFLVGLGTRIGSGCTSGHGVCGLSRLSYRSIAATATFMAAGFATVALMRALGLGW